MNEHTKELIAIGAAAAVNCRPCLEHHWRSAMEAGVTATEALEAAEVGLTVNRGAAAGTRGYVREVIKDETRREQRADLSGCPCAD